MLLSGKLSYAAHHCMTSLHGYVQPLQLMQMCILWQSPMGARLLAWLLGRVI